MMERRWFQPGVLAVIVALLVWPVIADTDDFPLSTYPMYSRVRPSQVAFVTAQAVDRDGRVVVLGLEVIGASDDPLVVAGELRAAVRSGQATERCELIWSRLSAARDDAMKLTVRVVTEWHDAVEHTADRPSLIERTVHAECGGSA